MVITLVILTCDQGRRSVRGRVDTSGFSRDGSSARHDAGRKSPHRRPASSKAPAALGAPPKRFAQVKAPWDSPVRTQAPQADSSNHQERTTQTVQPLPRWTCPKVTVSGPTHRGPHTPPIALSEVLDLNSEEPVYHTFEDELEHREREGSPHSQRSGDWDPHAMNVDEESLVGRDRRLTLTEVKAWSFG